MKIYDCSLNSFSPKHRLDSFGPKENDMMFDLKRYSNQLDIEFVDDHKLADRIITNTTYTPEIIEWSKTNSIPLIKRMDGVFWRTDLIDRNKSLNEAAKQSDSVIFISKFSKKSFRDLYPDDKLNKKYVILNNVDNNIFFSLYVNLYKIKTWGISASNWIRDEKRPDLLLKFADLTQEYGEKIILIGESNNMKHENIVSVGYFDDYNLLANTINDVDAWVNFSYRDAAPKTVLQAIRCNKPVLYADSGGLSELVGDFGVSIKDNKDITFDDGNYEIDFDIVKEKYLLFKEIYNNGEFEEPIHKKYIDTLQEYVSIIKCTEKCF